ncbi:DUF4440 domain-containing protein [Moritella sp. Urea-trap-13]|uniref:nuclear transport factor 2 family protein n=1 Tax=Moritella sp. Urea-trap-13 TaxID=2058327 RepID=UPI000C334A93|nr:DUF4440 domain-containing protein [Moritella sp. Urea-trap-13]PKH06206.1 hypothetical protein CXF93_09770 [Moritella sp. Urea-trap-13]
MDSVNKSAAQLIEQFKQREETLLHSDFSKYPEQLDNFLHSELFEISPIGSYTSRNEIVTWLLAKSPTQRWQLSEFKVVELAADTILVCYQANSINAGIVKAAGSLRSSIWRYHNQQWRLQFHQATKN